MDPARKLLGHVDRLAAIKAGKRPPPVNVEIDLSNRCSLGCRWCHFAYTHSRGPLAGAKTPLAYTETGDLMDRKLALDIVRQLATAGVRSVTWSGGGEPTLHPDFGRIVAETVRLRLDQGLYTHGGHLDEETAAILKRGVIWVFVSLDAACGDDYARLKGVPASRFREVVEGIKRLVRAKGKATVGIGYLVNRETKAGLERMLRLKRELGADYIQFRPSILYDPAHPSRLNEDTGWLDEDFIARLAALAGEPDVILDLNRFLLYRNWQEHGYGTCWWSALQTVITPNGLVWGCLNKRGHKPAALGDLTQESFANIWQAAPIRMVDGDCRVMCRGHLPNLSLAALGGEGEHRNFI